MILRNHKIIFVHIPKTAGQAIIRYFLENQGIDFDLEIEEFGLVKNLERNLPGPENYHHFFLDEYISFDFCTEAEAEKYFKFCISRNPYDRFKSAFYFNRLQKKTSYKEFIKNFPTDTDSDLYRHFCPQSLYITSNNLKIDKIFSLEDDLKTNNFYNFFKEHYGFDKPIVETNTGKWTKLAPLDKDTIKFINDFYKEDFENFGYERITNE